MLQDGRDRTMTRAATSLFPPTLSPDSSPPWGKKSVIGLTAFCLARRRERVRVFSMTHTWHLLKSADREVYGPVSLDQLKSWAAEAKISPLDKVSADGKQTWQRAPMITELQMDWLIEMPDNSLYGPTSVGTLQEFLATGEIDGHVTIINCLDGSTTRLEELPFFKASPQQIRSAETTFHGTQMPEQSHHGEDSAAVKHRIAWLERQVIDLQHALGVAENQIESLRQQYIEATGREPN
jgi:hypothetical protein